MILMSLVLGGTLLASAASATPAATPVAPALTPAECAVWQREQSFARSVAEHDAAAFAAHLHENAVFGVASQDPSRGRDVIVQRWTGLIEGKRVRLSWYPTRVAIVPGVEDTAWSSGPSLIEVLDPQAKDRYLIGAFHSVWRRGTDGTWRVLFDDGVEQRPATPEQVAAFREGRTDCNAAAPAPRS